MVDDLDGYEICLLGHAIRLAANDTGEKGSVAKYVFLGLVDGIGAPSGSPFKLDVARADAAVQYVGVGALACRVVVEICRDNSLSKN